MMTTCAEKRVGEKGFSLIEALAALALTGLVLSALATITAQWLPSWNRGFDRIQQSELVGISMRRIAADLAAAEYVPPNRDQVKPLFDGSALSVTFVRTALGPNVGVGLDVVRIGETTDQGRLVTVRSRAAFGPLPPGLPPWNRSMFQTRWYCCGRRSVCRSPMPVLTASSGIPGKMPTSCRRLSCSPCGMSPAGASCRCRR